ncbi:MAG: WG repeat-containing protein [Floccifex sp.]
METKYHILDCNIPQFEYTPITNYQKDGYFVKVNGKYGFIGVDGNYIVEPKYEYGQLYWNEKEGNLVETCLLVTSEQKGTGQGENLDYYLGLSNQQYMFSGSGLNAGGDYYLDNNQNIYYFEEIIVSFGQLQDFETFDDNEVFILNTRTIFNKEKDSEFYIITKDQKLFGPYDELEVPTFSLYCNQLRKTNHLSFYNDWIFFSNLNGNDPLNCNVFGLFYEKVDNKYRIWTSDGKKSSDLLFDSAIPISNTEMKVGINGKLGILDSNLNLVLLGDFEDITCPINNEAFVKINGKWEKISIDSNF